MSAQETQGDISIQHLCGLGGVSRAGFYRSFKAFHHEQANAFKRQLAAQIGAAYFNLALKDATIARANREIRVPTFEQIQRVLDTMPIETEVEQRNRAMVALGPDRRPSQCASFDATEAC
jgi:hypothetical protein